jgi:hypothetical protein
VLTNNIVTHVNQWYLRKKLSIKKKKKKEIFQLFFKKQINTQTTTQRHPIVNLEASSTQRSFSPKKINQSSSSIWKKTKSKLLTMISLPKSKLHHNFSIKM